MPGPLHTVWGRHGESEHNLLVRAEKEGWLEMLPEEVRTRPDWQHPLTPNGHRQGDIAHDWMADHIGDPDTYFDAFLCSEAIRARQTAGHFAPNARWRKHSALIEQDWGEFGITPYEERSQRFPFTTKNRKENKLYARLDAGESPFDQYFRLVLFRNSLRVKYDGKKVLIAAHGGTQMVARYMYERMWPEEYQASEEDPTQALGNCALLETARVNPFDPEEIAPYDRWCRITQPDNPSKSPFGGEWRELPGRREYTGVELLQQAEHFPPLITPEIYAKIPPKKD